MGFNLKNRLNNHLKNVSTQAMPKSRSNVIKTLTDADGAFDVVVDKLDIVPNALGDADKLFNEIKDKFNIQNQSIIGDGTDGDIFAGFCKSFGNDEDGNGLVEFVGERFFFVIVFHLASAFIFLFIVHWRWEGAI